MTERVKRERVKRERVEEGIEQKRRLTYWHKHNHLKQLILTLALKEIIRRTTK